MKVGQSTTSNCAKKQSGQYHKEVPPGPISEMDDWADARRMPSIPVQELLGLYLHPLIESPESKAAGRACSLLVAWVGRAPAIGWVTL